MNDSLLFDCQAERVEKLMRCFRIKADSHPGCSALSYHRALDSLQSFLNISGSSEEFPSARTVADWVVIMWHSGLAAKTIIRNIDLVSGLYTSAVSAGLVEPTDAFKYIKERLKCLISADCNLAINESDFSRFVNITKAADRLSGEDSLGVDLALGSIFLGGASMNQVALIKIDNQAIASREWFGLIERQSDSRRKYLFPLHQSSRTPNQLERDASDLINNALQRRGIRIFHDVPDALSSYWAMAALRCGASGSDVVAVLGRAPKGLPLLSLCLPADLSIQQKNNLIYKVTCLFTAESPRWFAMKLRPGVNFESLCQRFRNVSRSVTVPETFYPCEEILKRIGRKGSHMVTFKKPVLPDIVFFKTRMAEIAPLFSKIGDLAWCYTTGGRAGCGSYAAIKNSEFHNFQRAIAHFTPDYEVGPVGSLPLQKGDRIVVIGGDLSGFEGEVITDSPCEPGVIYRVKLFGNLQDIEWRVRDARLIEKIHQPISG